MITSRRQNLPVSGLLALSFCLVLFASQSSAEEEIIVNLKASDLKYDQEKGLILATGSVEAKLKGFIISSDSLQVDTNTKIVTAEGNVSLKGDEYSATGSSLLYNASSETGVMSHFYTVFAPKDIKGNVYVRVEEFYELPGNKWGSESDITTCDYAEPHYDVRAKRFEYYPDDKLVGYSVTFYISRIPVAWFPVWIYSFKKRRASLMPVIGHNQVEGNFAKFAFDYFINNDANGLIYIDLMQKKGLGKGIGHDYRLDKDNTGTLYLYHLEERDTGLTDWVTRLDHSTQINDSTKMSFLGKYADIYLVPFGRLDQTYGKLALDHSSDRKWNFNVDAIDDRWGGLESYNLSGAHRMNDLNTTLVSGFSRGKATPNWNRFNTRLTHDQNLFRDNTTFSTVLNFSKNSVSEDQPGDELFQPQVQFLDREDEFSLKVFQNWYIDTDRDLYPLDKNNEFIERQPEVTVSLKPRQIGILDQDLFTLNTDLGGGRYREVKWISTTSHLRDYTTDRYNANLTATRAIPLGYGSKLSLMGGVEQYLYKPGDQRYVLKDSIGLGTDLWGFFSNSVNYQRGLSEGNTPFFFDIIGVNYENISDTMTLYYQDKVRWVNSCGFNYRTKLYNDFLTRLTVRPDERIEGNVSTGYDINNKLYRDLVLGLRFRPFQKISWSWDSIHDINNNLFKSGSSILDAEIFDDWRYNFHVRVGHNYDYFTGRFIMRDLMIVKNLHCWEMKYAYSDWLKEWRVTFTLKAFPEVPVGWGAGDRGSFFEGFSTDSFLQNFNQQSPSRF